MVDTYDVTLAQNLDSLLNEREKLLREFQPKLQKLDQLIAAYRGASHVVTDGIPPAKPGEFKGQRPIDALESYVRARREFKKIPFKTAVADLTVGGAYHGKPRGKKTDPTRLISHNLKIALGNRRDTFGYEPLVDSLRGVDDDKIFLWLAPTAHDPKPRRR